MSIEDGVIGQRPDAPHGLRERPDGGRLGRLGRAVLSRTEQAAADRRVDQARKREALRPAHTRALGLRREAEADVANARMQLNAALVAFLIGDEDESAVDEIERDVEEAERRVRRYAAGIRSLEDRLNIIRDGAGHIIDAGM